MNQYVAQYSTAARNAAYRKDWATVNGCAKEILKLDSQSAEGYFLSGLVAKASGQPVEATEAFATALDLDADRYDAAIELANQHCTASLDAIERMQQAKFIPYAIAMFDKGFAACRGADRAAYEAAAKQLAPRQAAKPLSNMAMA